MNNRVYLSAFSSFYRSWQRKELANTVSEGRQHSIKDIEFRTGRHGGRSIAEK